MSPSETARELLHKSAQEATLVSHIDCASAHGSGVLLLCLVQALSQEVAHGINVSVLQTGRVKDSHIRPLSLYVDQAGCLQTAPNKMCWLWQPGTPNHILSALPTHLTRLYMFQLGMPATDLLTVRLNEHA